jgi:hypothetical protein
MQFIANDNTHTHAAHAHTHTHTHSAFFYPQALWSLVSLRFNGHPRALFSLTSALQLLSPRRLSGPQAARIGLASVGLPEMPPHASE